MFSKQDWREFIQIIDENDNINGGIISMPQLVMEALELALQKEEKKLWRLLLTDMQNHLFDNLGNASNDNQLSIL